MTPEDLARLHAASFATPRPWSRDEFAALIIQNGVFLLTRPTGFLLGRAIAGEAELLTLAVDPAARRSGTARALVQEFFDTARVKHCDSAFLEVAADNAPARALYAATGWRESGLRRAYYKAPNGEKIDAIVMTASLVAD